MKEDNRLFGGLLNFVDMNIISVIATVAVIMVANVIIGKIIIFIAIRGLKERICGFEFSKDD